MVFSCGYEKNRQIQAAQKRRKNLLRPSPVSARVGVENKPRSCSLSAL
jgi:hypothetical protein